MLAEALGEELVAASVDAGEGARPGRDDPARERLERPDAPGGEARGELQAPDGGEARAQPGERPGAPPDGEGVELVELEPQRVSACSMSPSRWVAWPVAMRRLISERTQPSSTTATEAVAVLVSRASRRIRPSRLPRPRPGASRHEITRGLGGVEAKR